MVTYNRWNMESCLSLSRFYFVSSWKCIYIRNLHNQLENDLSRIRYTNAVNRNCNLLGPYTQNSIKFTYVFNKSDCLILLNNLQFSWRTIADHRHAFVFLQPISNSPRSLVAASCAIKVQWNKYKVYTFLSAFYENIVELNHYDLWRFTETKIDSS